MMKTGTRALALAIPLVLAMQAWAAGSPFVGTWKINPQKSQVAGRTILITKTANGFHYGGGGGEDYDFSLDGKDYPSEGGYFHSWKEAAVNRWQESTKIGGKAVETSQIEISRDGKTYTERYQWINPDGSKSPGKIIRTRISGGPGLAGAWKTLHASLDPDVTVVTEPAPGTLRWETPSRQEVIEGPTDGTPFEMKGPLVPKDWVATFKLKDATTLEWTGGWKDSPSVSGVNTLSADGKTLTSVYWTVGKEAERFTEVSDKQ